ncbi:MAG TPA: chemotaxis protein CheD [Pirellulaceae bacterium]|nr:chemotaxis protein CheD [Pirellulaceae bacterium]
MPALLPSRPSVKTNVGMGQIAIGRDSDELIAVLGSCVGLVLLNPQQRLAVLAHVVLPASSGRAGLPGKYADTAIPEMLDLLASEGQLASGLVAKLAGGANMFGNSSGPMQIGEGNIAAVTKILAQHNIRVIAKDLGGSKGRRVTVNCQTGLVEVEVVGTQTALL